MRLRLVSLLTVAVATVVAVPPAVAGSTGGRRSMTLQARSANAGPVVQQPPACDATGQCIGTYSASSTMSGDLTGTLAVEAVVHLVFGNTTVSQANLQLFSGTVEGCGTGTFVIQLPLQPISLVAPSVSTGVSIVKGSGTGDLTGISGTVVEGFTPDPAGGGTGDFTFKIRCHSH